MSGDGSLRYDRFVDPDAKDSLSRIAGLIPPGSAVLDLGASTGALGRALSQCTVDGVELDAAAAAKARPHYRKLLELDLETAHLGEHFAAGAYDVIVCADVLEHLRDPGRVLDDARSLLAPSGRLLISVPNIGYAGVIAGLIKGEFKYRPVGLLDSTHLRFFTRSGLLELLATHQFHAQTLRPLYADIGNTEFHQHHLDELAPSVLRALLAQPDALAYQFLVEVLPGPGPAPAAEGAPPPPRFGVQLYIGRGGRFDEEHSVRAGGVLGAARQKIELRWGPLAEPPAALRLDIADRPGYLRLHSISIAAVDGASAWTWDGRPESLMRHSQLSVLGDLWLASGDDPSVELPVPSEALAGLAAGGTLSLELDWPLSGDFVYARELLDDRERAWVAERAVLASRIEAVEASALQGDRERAARLQEVQVALAETAARLAALRDEATRRFESSEQNLRDLRDEATRRFESSEQHLGDLRNRGGTLHHQIHRLSERLAAFERLPRLQQLVVRARRELALAIVEFEAVPGGQVIVLAPGRYDSKEMPASFTLVPRRGRMPAGLCELRFEVPYFHGVGAPTLYLDTGLGFEAEGAIALPRPEGGLVSATLRLPHGLRSVRLDPLGAAGAVSLGQLQIRELGRLKPALNLAAPLLRDPRRLVRALGKALSVVRRDGVRGLKGAIAERAGTVDYDAWIAEFDTLSSIDREQIQARIAALPRRPSFSVLLPVHDPPPAFLRRAIESVRTQLYGDWELCIADDASRSPEIRALLEETARDPRVRLIIRAENGHIAAASNSALELASGEFVALLDHDDELAPHALYLLAEELAAFPTADIIYSDEDKIDERGRRFEPHFKPDWNPELALSQNYVSHLSAYRAQLVRETGGFRQGFEGSQDHDLLLRCAARSAPERIRHVPHVLYHWRAAAGSTATGLAQKPYAQGAGEAALRDAFGPGTVVTAGPCPGTYRLRPPPTEAAPLASIIIPTRDRVDLLQRCVESLFAKTTYAPFELIVVDNQSRDPATLAYLQSLSERGARVLRYDQPFNYSAINNFAVAHSRGTVLAFLNNDLEVIAPDWLSDLIAHATRDGIGAAGAKLLYPDGKIQHSGVVLGLHGLAGHVFRGLDSNTNKQHCRAQLLQAVSAVTGACLVVRREAFDRVGGFDEAHLPVAFNDVDLCLRLCEAGLRNVLVPDALLTHHEYATRGQDDTPSKRARFAAETAYMHQRWNLEDPYYSLNLSLHSDTAELAWPPRAPRPWKTVKA